jgi:hypothetical protein
MINMFMSELKPPWIPKRQKPGAPKSSPLIRYSVAGSLKYFFFSKLKLRSFKEEAI